MENLPKNWFHYPAPTILRKIGQYWVNQQKSIALKVPSAILHTSQNILLNCKHPDYHRVKVCDIKPFYFDQRLIKYKN